MKLTSLFPESIISPKVGQALDANEALVGAYESASRPTLSYTAENEVGGRLSMFTIRIEMTSFGLASSQDFTGVRYDASEPPSRRVCVMLTRS